MGICNSCEKTKEATAKLILEDGTLQQFHYPVKVSYLLLKSPSCFICNADEMEFDGVVSAVSDDEELQPGQLYFALPFSRLNRRLQPEEMATLAVKASFALTKIGGSFVGEIVGKPSKVAAGGGRGGNSGPGRRRCGGAGRRGKFTARLSTIAE